MPAAILSATGKPCFARATSKDAWVISVDEKPSIQALERAQTCLRLPSVQAVRGHTNEYKPNGTITVFAARDVHTGLVQVGYYQRMRRKEFLDFMNRVVAQHPDTGLHAVMDNLISHKPKNDVRLKRYPNVNLHYTPTHASWLNQIDVWFSILTSKVLRNLSTTNPRELWRAIDHFTASHNQDSVPFEWTKCVVHPVDLEKPYADL